MHSFAVFLVVFSLFLGSSFQDEKFVPFGVEIDTDLDPKYYEREVFERNAAYYQQLVPLPGGLGNQNGKTYLRHSTMIELFGQPCSLVSSCTSVTNPSLRSMIQTRHVGPFYVTGMSQAIDALARALQRVKNEKPALYSVLGTAGMLCCRAIRGSSSRFSNHAWGAAIDIKIGGQLDPRADGKAQRGLHELYPYMAEQGFFWAAGYSAAYEDAMHFEIADEVMRNWRQGNWGSCTSSGGAPGECKDYNQCGGQTEQNRCPGPSNIRCCFNEQGQVPSYKCVSVSALNVRSGPCTYYSVIAKAYRGNALQVIDANERAGCNYNWIQVRYNGITGWIANSPSFVYSCIPSQASSLNITIPNEPVNGTFLGEAEHGDEYIGEEDDKESNAVYFYSFLMPFLCLMATYLWF